MIFNGFYGLEVRFMQIRMDKENRELKAHGSYEFPVNISYEQHGPHPEFPSGP